MKSKNVYTSVGCNRTCESADWGPNGLIVFGACNSVAVFDTKLNGSCKITNTFTEHTKRVNTVKWIRRQKTNSSNEFISGSDDTRAIIWNISDPTAPDRQVLEGHSHGVTVVETIEIDGKLTVATASADSTIRLWAFQEETNKYNCFQVISLRSGFCFALRMAILPRTNQILLAFSSDDDRIHLLRESLEDDVRKFQPVHQLVGHEDWVRGLDFTVAEDDDLLLASCSQDTFIRLWRISARSNQEIDENKIDLFNIPTGDIHVEEKIFVVESMSKKAENFLFAVSLESVLQGHEAWVYGVHWCHSKDGLQLLSSSIDKTLIIWAPTEDGIWMEKIRVGEVGGNSLGFYGGKFAEHGQSIMGHGFQGSFHIWNQSKDDEKFWNPDNIIGGHFADVRDICWEPNGEFIYSVSADQTTRIHAPWYRENTSDITWHEIARPQVHGYDMQCIAVLSRYKFASGAEEKIVRTFQAPGNFVENFRRICNVTSDTEGDKIIESMPKGASVPSLGLSNKAVFESNLEQPQQKHVKDEYPENYFVPMTLNSPPQEETLMQNTLWPEIQKLYGHGFEIFALASSSDGKYLASSCRATTAEHAQLIVWDTSNWKQIQKLASHQLTVTQIKFSRDNNYILSVSRDRCWSLFQNKNKTGLCNYELVARTDKKNGIHGRIIWSCDWSHDSNYFLTTSRDGKAVIWGRGSETSGSSLGEWKVVGCLELKNQSITACAFSHRHFQNDGYLIAVGLESGVIKLYSFTTDWTELLSLETQYSHHLAVKRLQFRPCYDAIQLASCGEDHLVRIYEFSV